MTTGIQFNRLILKNFLSFGNNPTVFDLRGDHITVVLGLNHDTGGAESRNGVGKSAMIDALCYVLYGKTIRGITNTKLVNKMARKGQGMLVVLELETPEGQFRIERGEAPSKMRLFKKEVGDEADFLSRDGKTFIYDITKGKNETTAEIERIIGFDLKLFEFLIVNSSETDAFMKLPEEKKREIAERLMGLNLLTERARELKEDRKIANRDLIGQESSLEATKQANERITNQIREIELKSQRWIEGRQTKIQSISENIAQMEQIDTEEQIELLKLVAELKAENNRIRGEQREAETALKEAQRNLRDIITEKTNAEKKLHDYEHQKEKIDSSTCPTCHQHWVADRDVREQIEHEITDLREFTEESVSLLEEAQKHIDTATAKVGEVAAEKAELTATEKEVSEFEIVFDSIEEASSMGAQLAHLRETLETVTQDQNPYLESIEGFKNNALKQIDDSEIKELRRLISHYSYLIELLQSKDSFLRKAVIDRWLPKLNGRIMHYLELLELPYAVRIENDLSMTVNDFGETYDWGNLSRGQRQRVTIALNLAFQDLFESTNHPLSLLMIDELVDSGICSRGAARALEAFRETSAEKGKRVFLITHRDDIADQIPDVLLIEMRNRISRINQEEEEENMEEDGE